MEKDAKSMFVMALSVILIIIITKTLFQSAEELPSLNFVNGSKPNQNSTDHNLIFNLSNNTGHSEHPKVAVDGNNVYVVWADDTFGTRDIYFRKSTDNGCTFGETIDISNLNGGSVDPQIAASGNNVYVLWEHTPENNGAIFFTKSSDNGNSFEKARNIANNTGFKGF